MMKMEDCRKTDQQFTHLSVDNVLTVFNVGALDRYLRHTLATPEWIAISDAQGRSVEERNGIEEARMALITEDSLSRPVIFAEFPDGEYLLIEGSHRLVYAWRHKKGEILGWLVKEEVWKNFIIDVESQMKGTDITPRMVAEQLIGRTFPHDVVITLRRY